MERVAMRLHTCAFLAAVFTSIVPTVGAAQQSFIEDPTIRQLGDQDIDADQVLLEALRNAAKKGPMFRLSQESVSIDVETGERARVVVRILNTGDEIGDIKGVNLLGSFQGLDLETDCAGELAEAEACDMTITFQSDTARSIETAILASVNERDRTTIEIPVRVEAKNPPPPPPIVEPTPEPVRPVVVAPPVPQGPTSMDIAQAYMRAMNPRGPFMANTPRGFTVVSASRDPLLEAEIAGVTYDQMRIETVYSDERFPDTVLSTEASLPVSRDRILTTDRVIKAVLETPVSNVMCAKVVALVESDVYSATSSVPLIQAGSRVIGECQTFVGERVGIAWNRIITVDGRSISFAQREADTRDAMGLGGALGRAYMSPFDRYVLPIFSTMIDTAAGVILATFGEDTQVVTDANGNISQSNSAANEGLQIVTNEARGTAQQIIADIRDVREIVVVPAGSRIDVEISEDIYFKDERQIVRLADMRFDLDGINAGVATRDLPQDITLVPAETGYQGATIQIGSIRYRIQSTAAVDANREPVPDATQQVLDDLAAAPLENSAPNQQPAQ